MVEVTDGYLSPLDEIQGRLGNVHAMLMMMSGQGVAAFEDIHAHDKDAYINICLENLARATYLVDGL